MIATIAELETALSEMGATGIHVNFGPSASPLRRGQWFVNGSLRGEPLEQVRGETLCDALNALLGNCAPLDLVVKRGDVVAVKAPSLSELLV